MIKEENLAKLIINRLEPYFHIYPEFKGEFSHWNQKRDVYLDLGLFPKEETIDSGFPKFFFGIEIKCFNLNVKEFNLIEKTNNLIHQCISYKYSKFGKNKMEPAFILIADNFNIDNFREEFEHELFRSYIQQTISIKQFAFQHNIGRLTMYDDNITFKMQNSFWNNKSGFKNQNLLDFYCGNRDVKNKFKKVLKPYEH